MSARLPHGLPDDVRAEARRMRRLGFVYVGTLRTGHLGFEHPEHGRDELPHTPSDRHWREGHRRDLARLMGISRRELEARLGVARGRRSGARRRQGRNEAGRRARRLRLALGDRRRPRMDPSPRRRMEEIARSIHRESERMDHAAGEDYRLCLRRIGLLRREYLEAEAEAEAGRRAA